MTVGSNAIKGKDALLAINPFVDYMDASTYGRACTIKTKMIQHARLGLDLMFRCT